MSINYLLELVRKAGGIGVILLVSMILCLSVCQSVCLSINHLLELVRKAGGIGVFLLVSMILFLSVSLSVN